VPEASMNDGYWEVLERKTRRQHWHKLILAPEALRMNRAGLSQREIARRMGVSQSSVFRMCRYQRQREEVEHAAPKGSVEWAHNLTCPGCGTHGMVVRKVERGSKFWTKYGDWIAGCVFFSFREFDGGCNGVVRIPGNLIGGRG
jgi:hypothetical protein